VTHDFVPLYQKCEGSLCKGAGRSDPTCFWHSALGMSFVQVARLSSRSLCIAQQCWVGLGLCSNRIFRDLWDLWQLHVFIIEYLVKIHIYTPLRSFCACLFLVAPCLHTSDSHLVDHRLIDLHSPKLLSSESDHPAIRNESVTGRFRSDILEKLSKASDSNSDVFSRWPQEGWCNSNFMSQKLILSYPPSCECAAPSPYLLTFNDP